MAFVYVTKPRIPMDCTLCKRLQGNRVSYPRRAGQDPGRDLILPEQTKPFSPWVMLGPCGHYYHAHCLARLNPAKYTNIDVTSPDGSHELIQVDEYDCLDCAGTQPNNSTFNPSMPEGTRTDVVSQYTNSHTAFSEAERIVDTYNARRIEMRQMVNIYTILDPMSYTLFDIQRNLDNVRQRAIDYVTCISNGIHGRENPIPNMFLFYQNGHIIHEVPYASFLTPITVKYNMDRLRVKELNVRQIYATENYTNQEKIRYLNQMVAEFKKYEAGEPNTVSVIEMFTTTQTMILEPTDRSRPLCVLNRHGQRKRFVVFDDFPIRENTGVCSVSGGTRRKRKIRKTKLIRNHY